jgi:hypothetical protein
MGATSLNRLGGALLAAALTTSCATTSTPGAQGPGDVVLVLAPGQTSAADAGPVRVRFDSVENDSRCPADAACIQAGDAVVGVTVTAADRRRQSYELHTTGATSVVHDGVTISVEGLDPRPAGSRPIRPADYRLTLRVRR